MDRFLQTVSLPTGNIDFNDSVKLANILDDTGRPFLNFQETNWIYEILAMYEKTYDRTTRTYDVDSIVREFNGKPRTKETFLNSSVFERSKANLDQLINTLQFNPNTVKGTIKCTRPGCTGKANFESLQTRSGDEGMSTFYNCTTCGKTWTINA